MLFAAELLPCIRRQMRLDVVLRQQIAVNVDCLRRANDSSQQQADERQPPRHQRVRLGRRAVLVLFAHVSFSSYK